MKRLTIGLFEDSFYPLMDGVIMVVDNYARKLSKYADVVVFAPRYRKKFDTSTLPYKVVRTRSIKMPMVDYSLPLPKLDRKFLKEVEKYHLDVVHIHSPFSLGRVGVHYAKKHGSVLIATLHAQFKQDFERFIPDKVLCRQLTKKLVVDVFDKCDKCLAVNSGIAKLYYEEYGMKVMPDVFDNATEMVKIDKKEADKFINQRHNIKAKDKVLLFVGRLNKLKNIIFLADAIKELELMKPKFSYKMIFVGSGQDEEELREHIKELGIGDNTIMAGKVTDRKLLAKYYARSDLFLFPSMYDASSIVQIEAASQETPGLFIEGSKTSCDIIDNETGFKSKEDPKEYAKKIIEIIENKELYNKVCKNVYEKVYVTWNQVVDQLYNMYVDLYKEKNNENKKDNTK